MTGEDFEQWVENRDMDRLEDKYFIATYTKKLEKMTLPLRFLYIFNE